MSMDLVILSARLARDIYDDKHFLNRTVYPRIVIVAFGALASIADFFKHDVLFGLKMPLTFTYVLIGWVPIGKDEANSWVFLGSYAPDAIKPSGQATTIKSAAFAFANIFITVFYGTYSPKECMGYYLPMQPEAHTVEEREEDPPEVEILPPLISEQDEKISSASSQKRRFDSSLFIQHEVPISPSRRDSSNSNNTYSPSKNLIGNDYRSPKRRSLIDFKPRICKNSRFNIDALTSQQKEAVEELLKIVRKGNPDNQINSLKRIFETGSWNICLSREIIAGLFWDIVAEHKDVDQYQLETQKNGGKVVSPLRSPLSCNAKKKVYAPLCEQGNLVVPLGSDSQRQIANFASIVKRYEDEKGENTEDADDQGWEMDDPQQQLLPLPDIFSEDNSKGGLDTSNPKELYFQDKDHLNTEIFSSVDIRSRVKELNELFKRKV